MLPRSITQQTRVSFISQLDGAASRADLRGEGSRNASTQQALMQRRRERVNLGLTSPCSRRWATPRRANGGNRLHRRHIFSAVLRLGDGRRRFDELTLPRFALWGGVAGLLVPAIAGVLGGLAGIMIFGGPGLQRGDLVVACMSSLLSAGSAAGSLAIAEESRRHSHVRFASASKTR
jgi:hypothetical protein